MIKLCSTNRFNEGEVERLINRNVRCRRNSTYIVMTILMKTILLGHAVCTRHHSEVEFLEHISDIRVLIA